LKAEQRHSGFLYCHKHSPAVVILTVDGSDHIPLSLPGSALDANPEDVYRVQYQRLVALLVRITGERGQAEELASETLCRLLARPALLRPGGNLEGWLYRTAMNLGLDALKLRVRRTHYERAAGVEALRSSPAANPLDNLLRAERQQRVRRVLALLKPSDARLLLLRHAGFSYQEAAEVLKINPASVGKLLARSMAAFEKRYAELYGSES
jgi:RNA polymerase sigma factor (sigma-70 family)